jgi:TM2 domain-containing membrane protein YozV
MHFCDPLRRMVTPWLTDRVDAFYMGLAVWFSDVSNGLRRFYTGYVGHYVMYVVLFLSALIFVELVWSPW